MLGLGGGNIGLGALAGVGAEYWPTISIGVGASAGALAQTQFPFGKSASTLFVAPHLAYRIAGDASEWLFTVGPGYAHTTAYSPNICFAMSCVPTPSRRGHGYVLDLTAGNIWRPSWLLLGAALRLNFIHPLIRSSTSTRLPAAQVAATFNLVGGFAL
jgi:hypothetical protein